MERLSAFHKRYLRGLAHPLKPVVFVGQKGMTPSLAAAMHDALDHHELVKVKFNEFKEKAKKMAVVAQIEQAAACELVGMVGHMATFFRLQPDPDKRKISLPSRGQG